MSETTVKCDNCGFWVTSTHQGDWDHTCPDGKPGQVHTYRLKASPFTARRGAPSYASDDRITVRLEPTDWTDQAYNALNTKLLGSNRSWRSR